MIQRSRNVLAVLLMAVCVVTVSLVASKLSKTGISPALPSAHAQAPSLAGGEVQPLALRSRKHAGKAVQQDATLLGSILTQTSIDAINPSATVSSCAADTYCMSPASRSRCYKVSFPDVEWQFCAVDKQKRGLWIEHVRLTDRKKAPAPKTIDVIYEAGVMDLFVPYHDGKSRAYDMKYCLSAPNSGAGNCQRKLDKSWASPQGFVDDFSPNSSVAVEVRDRGLAYLCISPFQSVARRGEEVVVWAVFDPGNYDNIMEYSFRDDGSIGFRSGVTGFNNPEAGMQTMPHMHNTLWRIDVDLDGWQNDLVKATSHVESALTAVDNVALVGGGRRDQSIGTPFYSRRSGWKTQNPRTVIKIRSVLNYSHCAQVPLATTALESLGHRATSQYRDFMQTSRT